MLGPHIGQFVRSNMLENNIFPGDTVMKKITSAEWTSGIVVGNGGRYVVVMKSLNPYATVAVTLTPTEFNQIFTDEVIADIRKLLT